MTRVEYEEIMEIISALTAICVDIGMYYTEESLVELLAERDTYKQRLKEKIVELLSNNSSKNFIIVFNVDIFTYILHLKIIYNRFFYKFAHYEKNIHYTTHVVNCMFCEITT